MPDLPLTPLARSLPASVPFVGPEAQERVLGRPFVARLGANESVFGPSPKAVTAMADAAQDAWMYPDPEGFELKAALARHAGVKPENIAIGEGIDGLLGVLARLAVSPGTPVVTSDGAYPTFNYHVVGFGGVLHKLAYREDREDAPALLAHANRIEAPLIYLSNPDNPMGSWLTAAEVEQALRSVPRGSVLCLDEAYGEFLQEGMPTLDVEDPRLIRMRTFSKAYGMAGCRIGYAIGPEPLIAAFDRVRNHFGVNRIAQVGALAALEDQVWLAEVVDKVAAGRSRVSDIATANGLTPLASAANFVTIDCGRDSAFAAAVMTGLIERGIFVRMPGSPPGNRCIRVTVGPEEALDAFAAALPDALAEAAA